MTIDESLNVLYICGITITMLFLIVIITCSICYIIRQMFKSEEHRLPTWYELFEFLEVGLQFMFFVYIFLGCVYFGSLIILIF